MTVKFEMDGQVAIATLASPPMNFLTIDLIEAFGNAAQAALDANARAFLTLAEGDHFCAAADVVKMFVGRDLNFGRRLLAQAFAVTYKIERLPTSAGLRAQTRRRTDSCVSLRQGAHQHHRLQWRQRSGYLDHGGNAADVRHGRHAQRGKALRRSRPSQIPRGSRVQRPLSRTRSATSR